MRALFSNFHIILCCCFFSALSLSSGKAQIERWRTLGLEDGLPQVQIYDMAQDPGGWVWIGTHGGVSRFDGSQFRNFTQRDGLKDNHTSCILPLGANEVFLGHTYASSFTYLKEDSVHPVRAVPGSYEGRGNDLLEKGGRIIAASSDGILIFEQQGDTVRFMSHLDSSDGLKNMEVDRLFDPGTGKIWAVHEKGVRRIDPSAEGSEMLGKQLPIEQKGSPVQFLKEEGKGLYVLEEDLLLLYQGAKAYLEKDPIERYSLPEDIEPTGFVKKKDELWVGSSEHGIYRILPDRRIRYGTEEGLPNEQITTLFLSDAGNVWFGTDQGVAHSTDLAFQFINKKNGLKDQIVWGIERGAGNDLWIGTEGGLTRIRFKTSSLLEIRGMDHIGKERGVEMIDALHLDDRGRLWVTNRGARTELLAIDAGSGEILERWPLPSEESYVAIEERSNGNILVGGGATAIFEVRTDASSGKIAPPDTFKAKKGTVPTDLWDMYRDLEGRVWIGSNGEGAGYLKGGEYHSLKGEGTPAPHPRPLSITEDKNGDIWFGTIGSGLIHYDGGSFDSITVEDGLTVNTPFFIQADGKGHVWAGTSNGVDRIGIRNGEVTPFGRGKGLVGMETNQNARERTKGGTLWFGTIKGLIRCRPDRISMDSIPPRLHLQDLKVSSKSRELEEEQVLEYDENHLRFKFIGVHPDDPGKISYRYKLKGLPDQQWSPITQKQTVTFNHLPPGKYEFQVKARNSDGFWTPEPLRYPFTITPPFWRTNWFFSSSGVLAVFLVLFIVRMRTRSLIHQQKRLEKEVAARTEELEQEKQRIQEINKDLEEQKAEAERQKELVESKNREITDSLRYAKRIQKALLKEEKRVSEHLPPHFVLFKPREHVSGDFYWALEKEGHLFVTVADCTGHGVPGAFMSMLGTAFLNEICAPEGLKGPGSILNELRQKVVKELAQDPDHEDLRDGMDISLLRVDLASREVVWAGANNPLLRILPIEHAPAEAPVTSKDGARTFIEYPGDPKPIGLSDDDTAFTEHRFMPAKGEKFYLFSDGFPDQFGGDRGKKYKSKNFKQLLLEVSAKPMDEQREALDEEFERWRGDQEQIDDVCVMGIAP